MGEAPGTVGSRDLWVRRWRQRCHLAVSPETRPYALSAPPKGAGWVTPNPFLLLLPTR